jgi:hypothetical protein
MVFRRMIRAPPSRTSVGRPQCAASKDHSTMQCGPTGIMELLVSNAPVLLCCVAPQSI